MKEYEAIESIDDTVIFKCSAIDLNEFIILYHKNLKKENKTVLVPVTCYEVKNIKL